VGFKVVGGELNGAYLLVWTTTPWTLPSNQAVAVNPDVTYVLVAGPDGRRYVLAQARLAAYARELGEEPEVLATYAGRQLLETRYLPPFPYFVDAPNSFRVLAADFVSTDDGTGIVHMSPAYGEDDMATTQPAGISAVTPVDSKGRFDDTVPDYAGQHVFDANPQIIRDLKNQGRAAAVNGAVLLRHETYEHSYPHCWRCRNPLIYRAVSSWFIKVTDHLVSRARQGRPVRQVALGCQGLVDLTKPLLGHADSGVEVRRSRLSAHRRVWQPRRA
jgi:isoleucyl-tRNA synthetase